MTGRFGKLLLLSLVAAAIGFWLSRSLDVDILTLLIISACLVLAAGGTVLLVSDRNGKLQRPRLLAAIVAIAIAICVGVIALVWYALAHSTDL